MKLKRLLPLIAVVMLPLAAVNAQTFLQFNNSASNTVNGMPGTINVTAGTSFTLSLQINSSVPTNAVDYWLSQFSGPTAGVFSITNRDFTASLYTDPNATNAQVIDPTDTGSNTVSQPTVPIMPGDRTPDGVPDNQLNPRNAYDLGSSTLSGSDAAAGTNQIATYTILVSGAASSGVYQLRSFDYSGFGWSSTALSDQAFSDQAAINVNITAVPEPSTWLAGIGAAGVIGYSLLRRRQTA